MLRQTANDMIVDNIFFIVIVFYVLYFIFLQRIQTSPREALSIGKNNHILQPNNPQFHFIADGEKCPP